MTIQRKVLSFSLIIAVCLSGLSFLRVNAQDNALQSQQIELIRSNCASIKNTLNQLHASDALMRVNRGQTYESILTKLIDKFNERLANNNINNDSLKSIKTEYKLDLDTFRNDYKTYEERLSDAIAVDCLKQPATFYEAVQSARSSRLIVHADTQRLNVLTEKYQQTLEQFEKDYKTVIEGLNK